jgi:hypothetical protein
MSKKAWVSAVVAVGAALIAALAGIPLVRRKVERDMAAADAELAAAKGCAARGAGGLVAC